MGDLVAKPLTVETWPQFERLVESHGGVWGGCWCMAFHPPRGNPPYTLDENRAAKKERVQRGDAHAALVFDGDDCVGWCQFGPVAELPRIKFKRAYDADLTTIPDWRITCFFSAKTHRRAGVASVALRGALAEIQRAGGGSVESYPEDAAERKVSNGFLYNATLSLFEQHGFKRTRRLGKHHWVVTRVIAGEGG